MLDKETLASRLREAIETSPLSQAAIAQACGVTEQAVSGWLRTGKIVQSRLPEIARLTGRPLEFFMTGAGSGSVPRESAINRGPEDDWDNVTGYGQAAGLGTGAEAQEYADTHTLKFKKSSLRRRGIYGRNLAVYYGKGDSMEPTIKDGDAILFDQSDVTPADGKLFLIQAPGAGSAEYFVKRAEILDGVVYFRSDNPVGDHNWRKPKRMDSSRHPIAVIGRVHWIAGWAD